MEEETAASDEESRRRVASSLTSRYSDWVVESLDELQGSFLLTDPSIPGHPIVYASRGLAALTGYPPAEVLGRNARLFQGAGTDRAAVAGVRDAVRCQRPHQTPILNYRRDGAAHWVLLHLAPVFHAADGAVLHFLAVQVPIPPPPPPARCRVARPTVVVFAPCREEARVEEELSCPCASHAGEVFVDVDKRGLDAEEPRVASEHEKEKALSTANSIFSALNRYSKLTGLVVCGKRCDSVGIPALSSSLNLSLGYSREEILGCNCKFLNGPGTSAEVLEEVAFHVWVHLDEGAKHDFNGLTPEVWQLGAVGAVRVAVRSLSASGSLLRPSQ
uniref:PAS domain-containing protein n=1 Tax=Leersia perrieri TaxID=77586 RepID=A0A0D9UXP0_9ORYZ